MVVRLRSDGTLGNAAPCEECWRWMQRCAAVNVYVNVFFSDGAPHAHISAPAVGARAHKFKGVASMWHLPEASSPRPAGRSERYRALQHAAPESAAHCHHKST